MSNVLKLSGPLKVGSLAAAPSNPQEGYIFFNTTSGTFEMYQNGGFRTVDAEGLAAHLTNDSNLKHDADEIDYQRANGSRKNIQVDATSPHVEAAISDLDDAIGALAASPSNYTPADAGIVADHLAAIDTALSTAGSTEYSDSVFRIKDNGDSSKKLAFEVSAITTSTTRTITAPDANVNLGQVNSSIQQDGSRAFTAAQSMGSNKLTNLATPTAGTDAANKNYVDNVAEGFKPKQAVRAASTANVAIATALEDGDSLDGVTLATGDRVLLKDQTASETNGIYIVAASGAASRATDFDSLTPIDEINGAWTAVQEGTVNQGKVFVQYGAVATLGTDPITFTLRNVVSDLVGGNGIDITGSTISVNVDASTIEINADTLRVKDAGITDAKIATGIDAAKLADGSVSNTELQYINSLTSNAQTQISSKIGNLVEDTTPELGGDLDVLAKAIESSTASVVLAGLSSVKRAKQASKSSFIEEEYIHSTALSGSQTATVLSGLTFAFASYEALEITYKLRQTSTNNVRIGTIRVVTNGTTVVLSDVFSDSADLGISFSAAINGSNVEVKYTSGTNGGTLRMDVKKFLT